MMSLSVDGLAVDDDTDDLVTRVGVLNTETCSDVDVDGVAASDCGVCVAR